MRSFDDIYRFLGIGVVITRSGADQPRKNVVTWKMVAVKDDK